MYVISPFPHFPSHLQEWGSSQNRLASVNFFLGLVGVVQVSRIVAYNTSHKKLTTGQQVEAAKEGAVESAQGLKKDVVEAVKS
jgi:mitochondrial pyruvate carrier 2